MSNPVRVANMQKTLRDLWLGHIFWVQRVVLFNRRSSAKCEEDKKLGIDTVKGEVLHIEKNTYVVQRFYGKEMQLNTDASTQVTGPIGL